MANLEDVLQDPNLDTDKPEDLNRLVTAMMGQDVGDVPGEVTTQVETAPGEGEAPKVETPTAVAEPKVDAAPAVPAAPAIQERPDGVLAKDGKNLLPYSVLEGTRAQAQAAKEHAEALQKQLDAANQQIESMKAGNTEAVQSSDDVADEITRLKEATEQIGEEAPWLLEQQKATIAMLEKLHAKTVQLEQQRPPEPVKPAGDDPVRAAIDATPALALWEASNADLFAQAVKVDQDLRALPQWKDKPLTDRFNKVVEVLRTMHGDEILPPELRKAPEPLKPTEKPLPTTDAAGISSLSDLKGGTPTAQTMKEAMDTADVATVAAQLAKLDSPEDIFRFVNG